MAIPSLAGTGNKNTTSPRIRQCLRADQRRAGAAGNDQSFFDSSSCRPRADGRETIERLQSKIEPTLTLILGLLLAWVLSAVLGPVYDAIGNIRT